jgi:hypothetical protein
MLATHLRLVPKSRLRGAITLLLLYPFVAWKETNLLFYANEDMKITNFLKRTKYFRDLGYFQI